MREKEERRIGPEIDFRRLWRMAVKLRRQILLTALLGAAVLFLGTWLFMPPQYEASATFYANNSAASGSSGITSSDITASKNLVDSYIVILKTRASLEEIIAYAGVSRTEEEVSRMISAGSADSTEIFEVVVRSAYPQEAFQIADAIAVILPERISSIWKGTSAAVVDLPAVPVEPEPSDCVRNGLVGFVLGLALSGTGLLLYEIFDTTIRWDEDIARACAYPVLASVPESSTRTGARMSADTAQSYEILRAKLRHCFAGEAGGHVIGLVGDDKSAMAVNLAYMLAQLDQRVLLVECDLRHPAVTDKLPVQKNQGLAEHLAGKAALAEVIRPCGLDETTFFVVPAGQSQQNPNKLLGSDAMGEAVGSFRKTFDYTVLALPPVSRIGDALAAAGFADGMLLAVRRDHCSRATLEDAVDQLEFMDAGILGIVSVRAEEKTK